MVRVAQLLTVVLMTVSAIGVRPQTAAPVVGGKMTSGGGLMHAPLRLTHADGFGGGFPLL